MTLSNILILAACALMLAAAFLFGPERGRSTVMWIAIIAALAIAIRLLS
jgi:hypothetical protein